MSLDLVWFLPGSYCCVKVPGVNSKLSTKSQVPSKNGPPEVKLHKTISNKVDHNDSNKCKANKEYVENVMRLLVQVEYLMNMSLYCSPSASQVSSVWLCHCVSRLCTSSSALEHTIRFISHIRTSANFLCGSETKTGLGTSPWSTHAQMYFLPQSVSQGKMPFIRNNQKIFQKSVRETLLSYAVQFCNLCMFWIRTFQNCTTDL